jgi:cysteinyl-tRNA synthetase
MSEALLGTSFDIHGGGSDLLFPHHENEIAQSCCAHPGTGFAQVWLHNEMLMVEGRKMSKSLGNFFTVRDLLDQGVPGEVIRFVMLMTHYRKPMDWTEEKRREAEAILSDWFARTENVEPDNNGIPLIIGALSDDLNTHLAFQEMRKLKSDPRVLKAAMMLLGFPDASNVDWWREREVGYVIGPSAESDENLSEMVRLTRPHAREWQRLRIAGDYGAADALKAKLEDAGIELRAHGADTRVLRRGQFDPAKLEALK